MSATLLGSVPAVAWQTLAAVCLSTLVPAAILAIVAKAGTHVAAVGRVYGPPGRDPSQAPADRVDGTLDAARLRAYRPGESRTVYDEKGDIVYTLLRGTLPGATRYRCPLGYRMRPLPDDRWICD
jgi:hypothetical protein